MNSAEELLKQFKQSEQIIQRFIDYHDTHGAAFDTIKSALEFAEISKDIIKSNEDDINNLKQLLIAAHHEQEIVGNEDNLAAFYTKLKDAMDQLSSKIIESSDDEELNDWDDQDGPSDEIDDFDTDEEKSTQKQQARSRSRSENISSSCDEDPYYDKEEHEPGFISKLPSWLTKTAVDNFFKAGEERANGENPRGPSPEIVKKMKSNLENLPNVGTAGFTNAIKRIEHHIKFPGWGNVDMDGGTRYITEDDYKEKIARAFKVIKKYNLAGTEHISDEFVEALISMLAVLIRDTNPDVSVDGYVPGELQQGKKHRFPSMCIDGPPGTGKTTIYNMLAEALGFKTHAISMAGRKDASLIYGLPASYANPCAGLIARAQYEQGTSKVMILFDEAEKAEGIALANALGQILEVDQVSYQDAYYEGPMNITEAAFVLTTNYFDKLPLHIQSRVNRLVLGGYTDEQQINILCNILPGMIENSSRQYKFATSNKDNLKKTKKIRHKKADVKAAYPTPFHYDEDYTQKDDVIRYIVEEYGINPGVRELKNLLGKVMSRVRTQVLKGKQPASLKKVDNKYIITPEVVKHVLGEPPVKNKELKFAMKNMQINRRDLNNLLNTIKARSDRTPTEDEIEKMLMYKKNVITYAKKARKILDEHLNIQNYAYKPLDREQKITYKENLEECDRHILSYAILSTDELQYANNKITEYGKAQNSMQVQKWEERISAHAQAREKKKNNLKEEIIQVKKEHEEFEAYIQNHKSDFENAVTINNLQNMSVSLTDENIKKIEDKLLAFNNRNDESQGDKMEKLRKSTSILTMERHIKLLKLHKQKLSEMKKNEHGKYTNDAIKLTQDKIQGLEARIKDNIPTEINRAFQERAYILQRILDAYDEKEPRDINEMAANIRNEYKDIRTQEHCASSGNKNNTDEQLVRFNMYKGGSSSPVNVGVSNSTFNDSSKSGRVYKSNGDNRERTRVDDSKHIREDDINDDNYDNNSDINYSEQNFNNQPGVRLSGSHRSDILKNASHKKDFIKQKDIGFKSNLLMYIRKVKWNDSITKSGLQPENKAGNWNDFCTRMLDLNNQQTHNQTLLTKHKVAIQDIKNNTFSNKIDDYIKTRDEKDKYIKASEEARNKYQNNSDMPKEWYSPEALLKEQLMKALHEHNYKAQKTNTGIQFADNAGRLIASSVGEFDIQFSHGNLSEKDISAVMPNLVAQVNNMATNPSIWHTIEIYGCKDDMQSILTTLSGALAGVKLDDDNNVNYEVKLQDDGTAETFEEYMDSPQKLNELTNDQAKIKEYLNIMNKYRQMQQNTLVARKRRKSKPAQR